MIAPTEMTLDELREALAERLAAEAVFDGWSDAALAAAARALGVPPEHARLAVPGGAVDMIDAWFAHVDRQMAADLPADVLANMRIRQRITALVQARIAIVEPHREALRRALAILAQPQNVATATRLGWRAADAMWRLAGDTATGFAHYSKRLSLGTIYGATLLAFLDDDSEGHADTRAFLDRRIGDIMAFEKLKAQFRPDPERHFNLARFLGRLRYPAR
jgi:ubiquinone biosynthesis protein COQ9